MLPEPKDGHPVLGPEHGSDLAIICLGLILIGVLLLCFFGVVGGPIR